MSDHNPIRHDVLELAADYAEFCVLITTAELDLPGPQIVYANTAFTRMTGYSVSDLLGKTPRILQGAETDKDLLRRLKASLQSGQDFIGRTTNYKRDGTAFQLEWIITHLRDDAGRTTNYIALQRDITGKQRAARQLLDFDQELRGANSKLLEAAAELQAAEAAMERKNRLSALGEITAGAVHDISNALTPVFGVVQLLHSVEALPTEARELTERLDLTLDHALNILANLRRYHQSGERSVRNEINLRDLLQRVPDVTQAKWSQPREAGDGSIAFALNLQESAQVIGDETELLQVFVNLVLNAVEAMPEGGTIDISLHTEGDNVVVYFADSGIGMSPELARSCFEPYVKGREGGSGLGLAVCQRIIHAHNGSIALQPDRQTGSGFKITLPVHDELQMAQRVQRRFSRALLIGETNDPDYQPIVEQLQQLGLTVEHASNADAGIARYFEIEVDVVLAQASLTPTSGFDAVAAIKRSERQTPVMVWMDPAARLTDLQRRVHIDAMISTPLHDKAVLEALAALDARPEISSTTSA